jgi:hypothetical protein
VVLNTCYGFEGSFRKLGSHQFFSHFLGGGEVVMFKTTSMTANRFRSTILADFPALLPENYLQGFDSQKGHEEIGLGRMKNGRVVRGGTFLSPFSTLAYKLPLGTLILIVASALMLLAGKLSADELVPAIPAFFLMLGLCTQTGLNWAFRYALPALPYLILVAGALVRSLWANRLGRVLVGGCLLWNAIEIGLVRPHYLAYGNELIGGPAGAAREFLGSNFDWGQDLLRLKRWCESHTYAMPLRLAYYGSMSPEIAGIATRPLPVELVRPKDNWLTGQGVSRHREPYFCAVSTSFLNGLEGNMDVEGFGAIPSTFQLPPRVDRTRPHARIGYTILVFRIDPPSDAPARDEAPDSGAGEVPRARIDAKSGTASPGDARLRAAAPVQSRLFVVDRDSKLMKGLHR